MQSLRASFNGAAVAQPARHSVRSSKPMVVQARSIEAGTYRCPQVANGDTMWLEWGARGR